MRFEESFVLLEKGVLPMMTVPLATGARLLGIHPKTLHHWLNEANLPLVPHPTDARIKCVGHEHLLEVASRHGRPLPDLAEVPASTEEHMRSLLGNLLEPERSTAAMPTPSPSEAEVLQKLISLETKIGTLQEQLSQLALALLQEREQRNGQRGDDRAATQEVLRSRGRPLHPADQRARTRLTALVEYGSQGRYVLLSPQEGELELIPDSQEWFDWLASLTSFRFVGKSGRFSAYREYRARGQTRSWTACRYFHHRTHKHFMGLTDHLTIDCLEQAAALLQAQILAR
jgi:hypothetical protein